MGDIRLCHETDLPHLYQICLLTGDAGKDASGKLSDRFIIGQYYAAPYVFFEKDLCFILDDNNKPAGYIIGASDTKAFNKWFNSFWLPPLRKQYPSTLNPKSDLEKWLISVINTDTEDNDFVSEYPAHLHIDILPSQHGKGYGKFMIERFVDKCSEKGSRGIHFGVDKKNENAIGFYKKIGMKVLLDAPGALFMGLKL
jgi:ribosomal protein S18 acetylase RimI-like enzyme